MTNHNGALTYLLGDGDGTFQNLQSVTLTNTGLLAFGDFNSDRRSDLAMPIVNTQGTVGFFKLLQNP